MKFKIQGLNFLFLFVASLFVGCTDPDLERQMDYDSRSSQSPVMRHSQLDSVIKGLRRIEFSDVDTAYLKHAGIDGNWRKELRKKTWYAVEGDQRYQYLVGRFRVQDFMPHKATYSDPTILIAPEDDGYLCIDKRVLHKLLDLMWWMEDHGLDHQQLAVNYGFRHPALNVKIGGAKRSRHQWGEAIDLLVGDVNSDGEVDASDKQPLLKVLEGKIIADAGGVGRYPGSQVIHMDVRGHRARWDHQ